MRNHVPKRDGVAKERLQRIGFQPAEELGIPNSAALRDFRIPGTHFTGRKRRKELGVCNHDPWLMKQADKILAFRYVNGRLATHGGIHLSEQGGGDVCMADATLHQTRRQASKIADDAATERHNQSRSIEAKADQFTAQRLERLEALRG